MELLAPAGGFEQVIAAVQSGADAVYFGSKSFNARRNAENFEDTSFAQMVEYCHDFQVKVYVTINTLIFDKELEDLKAVCDNVSSSCVDGVIIQDFAVLKYFRDNYPTIKRIASTQTAVHNCAGAQYLKDKGFQRIVLARELSLKEMQEIIRSVDIETEAFVHGAQCMSVSGACFTSSVLGERSGNRGLCAQPCRLDWQTAHGSSVLSLKDMNLIDHLKELDEIGVTSLKIEGRMRSPEYVATVVNSYKHVLLKQQYDRELLEKVFRRSGFTDGYFTGKRDRSMFGIRTQADIQETKEAEERIALNQWNRKIPLRYEFRMSKEETSLRLFDDGFTVTVKGPKPEMALSKPISEKRIKSGIEKTGDTIVTFTDGTIQLEDHLFLPISSVNELRRTAIQLFLEEKRKQLFPPISAVSSSFSIEKDHTREHSEYWARVYTPEQAMDLEDCSKVILPISKLNEQILRQAPYEIVGELPYVLFPEDEQTIKKQLKALIISGLTSVYANNIYGVQWALEEGIHVHLGFGLNITNQIALQEYMNPYTSSVTASIEMNRHWIHQLPSSVPKGYLASGHFNLMQFRNCPMKSFEGCDQCKQRGELVDRLNIHFPLECQDYRGSTLLNSVPVCALNQEDFNCDFSLLWFTRESKEEIQRVFATLRGECDWSKSFTKGLYYKNVQ